MKVLSTDFSASYEISELFSNFSYRKERVVALEAVIAASKLCAEVQKGLVSEVFINKL